MNVAEYPVITDAAMRDAVQAAHRWICRENITLNKACAYWAWKCGCDKQAVKAHVSARLAIDGRLDQVLARSVPQQVGHSGRVAPGQLSFDGLL